MNFEVHILGTSGMMPLVDRFLTSCALSRAGEIFLFDCGEGTQVAIKKANLKWKQISTIFISHMHADHVTGLMGLLMLSAQVDRIEPLYIYGPEALKEYIDESRKMLDAYINYPIIIKTAKEGVVIEREDLIISAKNITHKKPCLAYSVSEKERSGEFYPDKAIALNIPKGPLWGQLQKGENVEIDGKIITPNMVTGNKRKGRKFTFVTDALYNPDISEFAKDSDILVCEGMFEGSLLEDATKKQHLTCLQSATIARDANVKKLYLTHYSPRYSKFQLKALEAEARTIFEATKLGKDGLTINVALKD